MIAIAALAGVAACDEARPAKADHPERLDGTWTLELQLREPLRLVAGRARTPTLRGEAFLRENGPVTVAAGLDGTPTHYGTHAVDLRPFGLPRPARGTVPTVAARLIGADSVEAVLDPGAPGELTLRGSLHGDSVAGRWRYSSGRAGSAAGRFVMHHQ
jgi:hypothetical protein